MPRQSYRVRFPGGSGFELAGIVDAWVNDDKSPTTTHSHGNPVAVFSHCFTCNKDLKAIVRISRALADRGITVLRYDMTGLGGSDGDFSRTHFTSNLADLRAALEFAERELGPVTALIGHSFGGAASLAIAAQLADEKSIRCVATLAAPSDTQHLAKLLASRNANIESTGEGDVTIGGFRWLIRKEMLEDFRRHDLTSLLAKIKIPVMLFQSPQDGTVGFDHALRIMSLVQSATGGAGYASLVTLPNADHLLSDSPADISFVADCLAAFIARYATP